MSSPSATLIDAEVQHSYSDAEISAGSTPAHSMPFGAEVQPDGSVHFRLWAPAAQSVALKLEGSEETLPLNRRDEGWHELTTDAAHPGSLYRFVIDGDLEVPDPASRFQPRDLSGPSEVIDSGAYRWNDQEWKGRPWRETVVYEVHIGTFTPAGTFLGAIEKLDYLVELGVTAIEVMPIADFPGARNWGYDGALLYAPDSSYGRPEDLKALVDAAHARGLMVFLDVVYNHFGPDGNYLPKYAPQTFTKRHCTPWGDAINYDGEDSQTVRQFVVHNALYWLQEFHLDGLRLDAVHQIKDDGPVHLLDEISERVQSLRAGKPIHLILENEANEATRLVRNAAGRAVMYTGQWNDDVHHVLHTAATAEHHGYYADYVGDTEKLGRALAEGFAFQGEVMSCTHKPRGESSANIPPRGFVAFIQNHDQIGNRAFGERLTSIAAKEAVRAVAAVYLLMPQIPMLFMGEEWGSSSPFPFFCDFNPELGELVRKGRREEFASFPDFQDTAARERIPDPQAEETFRSAKLDWNERFNGEHADWLAWYRKILERRTEQIVPMVFQIGGGASSYEVIANGAVRVQWKSLDGRALHLIANLSNEPVPEPGQTRGRMFWLEGNKTEDGGLALWTVCWSVEELGS